MSDPKKTARLRNLGEGLSAALPPWWATLCVFALSAAWTALVLYLFPVR